MNTRLRAVALLTTSVAAAVAFASPALAAVSWGPLTSSYNGITRSSSNGTFYSDRGINADVHVWLNDTSNDSNNVYTNADIYFFETDQWTCQTQPCYVFDRTLRSREYTYFNTPVTFQMLDALHVQATSTRASIYTCVQLGWPVPDHCSGRAIVSFAY